MRAGKLDREIEIQSFTNTVDAVGTAVLTWTQFRCVRAQLIEARTEEFLRAYGEGRNTVAIFRIRWIAGVTTDHRVVYEGKTLNIREVKKIGRRRGLELRCEQVRA